MALETPSPVLVSDLEAPHGLPDALASAGARGTPGDVHAPLLHELELLDARGSLLLELQPVARAIAFPQLMLSLSLKHGRGSVQAQGWLNRDQAVVAVPESPGVEVGLRLLCFPTVHLAYRLGAFLGLGPRKLRGEAGAAVIGRGALGEIVGCGLDPGEARVVAGIDDPQADRLVEALSRPEALHWRVRLEDAPTGGETFAREAEAVDVGEQGLWLVGPGGDDARVLVTPAITTQAWRLLATMLPTQDETVAVLAAQDAR